MQIKSSTLLSPFRFLIEKTGGNFTQVCQMVDLKFLIDNRKANPVSSRRGQDSNNTMTRQLFTFLFIGTIFSLSFSQSENPFIFAFAMQAYITVMVAITMMSEYSVLLFDTRDNNLILPLPLSGQTIGWARVLHILLFLLMLSLSLALPATIMIGIKFGTATSLLFLLGTMLNTIFTLFFTLFIYLGLMKITSGEKLKDVMMYLQVALAIGIIIGYQFIPNQISQIATNTPLPEVKSFFLYIPPAWFAMLTALPKIQGTTVLLGSAIAVVLPLLSMALIGKKLFNGFENTLTELNVSDTNHKSAKPEKARKEEGWWFKTTSFFLGVSPSEKPVYKLMWKLALRERQFKQSLLPVLAYMVVFPLIMIFGKQQEWGDIATRYPIFLYFSVMTSSMIPSVMSIGSNIQTTWMFRIFPNMKPSLVFTSTFKAAFAIYFLPVYIGISAPLFYFKGMMAINDIVTIFLFNYLVAYAILYWQSPHMPFSQTKAAAQGGKTAIRMILFVFVAFPIGFLHYFLNKHNPFFVLGLAAVFALFIVLIENLWYPHSLTWKKVETMNKF